jgi:hypothetical protein
MFKFQEKVPPVNGEVLVQLKNIESKLLMLSEQFISSITVLKKCFLMRGRCLLCNTSKYYAFLVLAQYNNTDHK